MEKVSIEPLTSESFASFGDVIAATGAPSFLINQDKCERYHDLSRADTLGQFSEIALSIARSETYSLPYTLNLMERHPLGSQAFVPMNRVSFLVIVAPDDAGKPGRPQAFMASSGQGVNYFRNTWHGVLTPMEDQADFLIIDRIGNGENLEEHTFSTPYVIDHN